MKKILALTLLLYTSLVVTSFAAGALAGSEIKLQSTATYVDGIGQEQTVSSNEVIVIVAKKSGLALGPVGNPTTLTVSAGGVADYSYTLTNTGNDSDTYTVTLAPSLGADGDQISIFYDADFNGQVDAGDLLLAMAGTGTGTTVALPELSPDDIAGLIVRIVTKSGSATVGASNIFADFTVTSNSDPTVTDSRTGITTNLSTGEGVLSYYADANTEVAGLADTITFNLSGSNVGENGIYGQADIPFVSGAKDGVLVEFDLTNGAGVLDLDGSGAGAAINYAGVTINSQAPNTGVPYYWDGANSQWSDDNTVSPNGNPRVALFLEDPANGDEVLEIGQEFSLNFTIKSLDGITETPVVFTGNSTFDVDDSGKAGSTPSNNLTVRVGADSATNGQYTANIQPYNGATAGTVITGGSDRANFQHPAVKSNPAELKAGAQTLLAVTSVDETDAQTRSAGEEVYIPLTVQNPTGGAALDSYNITVASNSSAAGLIAIELLQADGITPLQDTDGDGLRDTGSIARTETKDIVVRLIIDESADVTAATTIVIRSTSSDGSTSDTTTINIHEILPAAVDIGITGTTGDVTTAGDDPAALTLTAGSSAAIAVDVQNVRTAEKGTTSQRATGDYDAYNLTYTSSGDLVVKFYEDVDGNGELEDSELNEILNTNSLTPVLDDANNIFNQMVSVIVPDDTVPGTYSITLTATSTNNSGSTDSITFDVTVEGSSSVDLEPEVFATAVAGGNIVISHTISNSGNVASDALTLKLPTALPAGYVAYWTNTIGENEGAGDSTGNNDPGSFVVTAIPANGTKTVYLRIGVPSSAPAGTTVSFEIQALDSTPTIVDSVVDVLQVVAGNLELVKSQSKTNGPFQITPLTDVTPGDDIFYQTEFKNLGSEELKTVVIYETIPECTELADANLILGGLATGGAVEYSNDGGVSWGAVGALADVTNIRVILSDSLLPGQSGTVVYQVTVTP